MIIENGFSAHSINNHDIVVEYDKAFVPAKTEEAHSQVVEQFAARIGKLPPAQRKTADAIAARHLERVAGI